ncbi:MAG: NAD(P)-dependent oxidoreductase [Alphaproteobacteria bacterium]|nr:NAD(P)-dependent oxidoreductase [Alphaproteobacteria bacterium]
MTHVPIVAVTGATGFIGSHLIQNLAKKKFLIKILSRRLPVNSFLSSANFEVIIGDVFDSTSIAILLKNADFLIHSAGLVKARNVSDFYKYNVEAVSHIVTLAQHYNPKIKVILISSLAAREPHLSSYAKSKAQGEKIIHASSLEYWIVRPPAVYGPGDTEILPFFKLAQKGFAFLPNKGQGRFSMIHVDDLTECLTSIIQFLPPNRSIFEPDDQQIFGYSWQDIVGIMSLIMKKKIISFKISPFVLNIIATANSWYKSFNSLYVPMLTQEKIKELTHDNWICNKSSMDLLKEWKPKIPLSQGFQETFDFYKKAGWL